jgi:mono/diheme cytochrome c family protein
MKNLQIAALLSLGLLTACGGDPPAKPEAPKAEPAAAPAPAAPPPAPVAAEPVAAAAPDGAQIYGTYCVACHGADGKGNNGLGGNYADVLPGKTDEALMASIKNGKTGAIGTMPPWGGTLNDEQIKAVLGYVKTTFGPKG